LEDIIEAARGFKRTVLRLAIFGAVVLVICLSADFVCRGIYNNVGLGVFILLVFSIGLHRYVDSWELEFAFSKFWSRMKAEASAREAYLKAKAEENKRSE